MSEADKGAIPRFSVVLTRTRGGGYRLRSTTRPAITVVADTVAEAEQKLFDEFRRITKERGKAPVPLKRRESGKPLGEMLAEDARALMGAARRIALRQGYAKLWVRCLEQALEAYEADGPASSEAAASSGTSQDRRKRVVVARSTHKVLIRARRIAESRASALITVAHIREALGEGWPGGKAGEDT